MPQFNPKSEEIKWSFIILFLLSFETDKGTILTCLLNVKPGKEDKRSCFCTFKKHMLTLTDKSFPVWLH
jgi:hypothetical protein